MLFTFQI